MLDFPTQNLHDTCVEFLKQTPQERLLTLKNFGLARYDFLTQISLTQANVACVMRFFREPSRVKFPNLRGADLSGLVLDGVNFIRGDLTGATLKASRLIEADLIFANLTGADLRDTDLRGATLNETIWLGALVEGCRLGTGIGLTHQQRTTLKAGGAVFG
ncbi:MAG TPA: pentapeptide repeat-containing protein [Allocoleopsis sp.]